MGKVLIEQDGTLNNLSVAPHGLPSDRPGCRASAGDQAGTSRGFLPRSLSLMNEEVPMARLPLFNSPLLLGFDHFERVLDRVSRSSGDGYPPYNVEQTGPSKLRITLAVAGFKRDDLSAMVEDNELIVRGKQSEDEGRVYLHRGIAARQFQRRFVLAEGIEITGASLANGLLSIDLLRPEVETRSRTVEIRDNEAGSGTASGSIHVEKAAATKTTEPAGS